MRGEIYEPPTSDYLLLNFYCELAMHKLLFILYFQLFSARELNDHVSRIKDLCENSNADWEKRCDSVRTLLVSSITFHLWI